MSTLGRESGISKPIRAKSTADMKADSKSSIGSKIANTYLMDLEPDDSNAECYNVDDWHLPEVDLKWMVEKPTKKVQFKSQDPISQPPLPEPSLSRTLRRILFTNLIFHYYLTDGKFKN